jgi:hypothetical protein
VEHAPEDGIFKEGPRNKIRRIRRQDRADVTAPRMADIGWFAQLEVFDEPANIFGKIAQAITGLRFVGFAVAAQVRRDDVKTAAKIFRDG